jgi:hypothetical protein
MAIILNNNINIAILKNDLNNIFRHTNDNIKSMLYQDNIKTRTYKLTFEDVVLYKFLSSYNNTNKFNVASNLSFHYDYADSSNYYMKEYKISVKYYENILESLLQ